MPEVFVEGRRNASYLLIRLLKGLQQLVVSATPPERCCGVRWNPECYQRIVRLPRLSCEPSR